MTWPVRSGEVPPLADNHSPRPETGVGSVSSLGPGETLVLTPATNPGERSPSKHSVSEDGLSERRPGEHRPGEHRPGEHRPGEHRPGEHRAGEHSPGEQDPSERSTGEYSTGEYSTGDRPGEYSTGGTGKTQLAAALARALWETRAVDLLVWVTAISRDAIVTAYAQAFADIGVAERGDDPGTAATRLLAWLAETGRPWLVVLDDLADPVDVTGLWPQGAAGRVLVTTQRRDQALRGPGRRTVPVGPFTLREALAYLTARLQDDPGQRTEALDLATDLGCHPLALAQATALMRDTGANCREYRLWSAERRRQLTGPAPGGPPSTLEVTWSLSIERANQLLPADLAEPALMLAAMMDPSGIPSAVLLSHAACSYITGHYATTADQTM